MCSLPPERNKVRSRKQWCQSKFQDLRQAELKRNKRPHRRLSVCASDSLLGRKTAVIMEVNFVRTSSKGYSRSPKLSPSRNATILSVLWQFQVVSPCDVVPPHQRRTPYRDDISHDCLHSMNGTYSIGRENSLYEGLFL